MPTTITGNVRDAGTTALKGVIVRFNLRGTRGNQPSIPGVGTLAPTAGACWYQDFVSDSSGNISGSLYSTRDAAGTGNGEIAVAGSYTAVWYGMVFIQNGKVGPEIPVHAKNGATLNIATVTPITTLPVATAPTGDTTYLRLDAGNGPMSNTGLVSNLNADLLDGHHSSEFATGTSPTTKAAESNKFLTAYNATTGAFTNARPTWADVDKTTSSLADIVTRNYSDLGGKPTLGDSAAKNVGTSAGTVAAGDDSRITAGLTRVFGYMCGSDDAAASLLDTADQATIFRAPAALTITEVWAQCDAGTPRIQLYKNTGSTVAILTDNTNAGVDCVTTHTGVTGSLHATNKILAAGDTVDFAMVSASTAKRVTVWVKYTLN